ncbi:cysteine desulfurase family protein [Burkholderiales bacterium JOSHI_001]|nr:cysteine desulfurase family protein [Burkholderiales bacterium JOSHI_001]
MNTAAPVYLDHNATTPVCPRALDEMLDVLQHAWANPSSTHAPGQAARRVLADARARVAAFAGAQAAELVFTSGATEANHMAVLGALAAREGSLRRRVLMSAVEHPGLLALGERLRGQGIPVDRVPVDAQGRLDLAALRSLLREDVALLSVMGANNETGVLMPVDDIAELAHAAGAWLHVDATQRLGKAPLPFAASGADLMSLSAHKIGGPKGVGALLVKKGITLPALISGRQERGRRGGTENLPGIAGFAAACDAVAATQADDIVRLAALRVRLEDGLRVALPDTVLISADAPRLPNTVCVRFAELDADVALTRLEKAGVLASSGAACSAGGTQPSHVLLAMGFTAKQARAGVRFSLGRGTTQAEIDFAIAAAQRALAPLLQDLREPEPAPA